MIKQIRQTKKSLKLFFTTGHLILSFSYLIILLLGIGLIPKLENVTKIIQNNINLVFWLMLLTIILDAVFFAISIFYDNLYLEEIVYTIARERENIERRTTSEIEEAMTALAEIKEKSVEIDFEKRNIDYDIKYLQSRLKDK